MGLKGKIFKFMSDILKDGSYHKFCTQAKSTSACGLPKGFFLEQRLLPITNCVSETVKALVISECSLDRCILYFLSCTLMFYFIT